ncbi:NAD(P)-dependent dehydrogenase (short-subunit alcohol dehydrogenase family) [Rhodococcus rhodochrous J45]|uniref:NAD(P)-dependent dehydrogenase (Short-subunit alcohol dehydrogenase family) n=1 Tax=Rhodococcus rhodochrous J45 TaxID=935266 RepID=A0A562E2K0_RHORH|nr:NAD(P)-dependent dehydrogenase (short-subunit alcohol dehydrogenase family) [Rhodococcus rhodochrous J45]
MTGASSGLGVAYARALAEAGAHVVIGARRADRLAETEAAVRGLGACVAAVETDVTKIEDCERLVTTAVDTFGRVDILVNNAGTGGEYHPVVQDPPDHFRSVMDVNVNGSYWMVQSCVRVMEPGSSIVNVSSVMALTTAKMPAAAYSASKAAVLGMTRDLAAQLGPRGIRVNAILPGVFPSEATAHYSENYKRRIVDARIPIGRIGDPRDIAAVVVFLASDAAAYVTGVSLPVDGGVLVN